MNQLERFVYYVVKNFRMQDYSVRNWDGLSKFKHYISYSLWLYDYMATKLDAEIINVKSKEYYITNQVLLAMDSENTYVYKTYYDNNEWPYTFECEFELDDTSMSYNEEKETPGINLLNKPEIPTNERVEDNAQEYFRDEYIEVRLTNESDEAELDDYQIHRNIKLPKNDMLVHWLNLNISEEDEWDMSDNEEYDKVSNVTGSKFVDDMYSKYQNFVCFGTENPDAESLARVNDVYKDYIKNMQITPLMFSKPDKS
tara:strand:- start:2295 stop:3062 length:768 start_codon:yes stop_codon:yes gene_type:complete